MSVDDDYYNPSCIQPCYYNNLILSYSISYDHIGLTMLLVSKKIIHSVIFIY